MKSIGFGIWALALVALFMASFDMPPATAQSRDTYVPPKTMWAAKRANVRVGPSTNHVKVGLLEIRERVRVVARTGNWFKLMGQARRFVYAPLLSDTRPASAGATAQTVLHENGRYRGPTRNGRPHGRGVLTWANGNRYEGDFSNGRRTGRGTFTWGKRTKWAGHRYEGDFLNEKRAGRGVYTWPNGNRYEGAFRNNERHGSGVYIYGDGRRVEGTWRDGKRTGRKAASTEKRTESTKSKKRSNGNGQREHWGALVFSYTDDTFGRQVYGLSWNYPSAREAEGAAEKACVKEGGRWCNTSERSIHLFSTWSPKHDRDYMDISGVSRARCIAVGKDRPPPHFFYAYTGNSESEAKHGLITAFPNSNVEVVRCNYR